MKSFQLFKKQMKKPNKEESMCRFKWMKNVGKALAVSFAILAVAGPRLALAAAVPANCQGAGTANTFIISTTPDGTNSVGQFVIVGEQLWFQLKVSEDCQGGGCSFQDGTIQIRTPDNNVTDATGGTGTVPLVCGGNQGVCLNGCPLGSVDHYNSTIVGPYTVSANDFDNAVTVAALCGVGSDPQIAAIATYTNGNGNCASTCHPCVLDFQCLTVLTPCISVTKEVACKPAGGDCTLASYCKSATGFIDDQPEAAFCYRITVDRKSTRLNSSHIPL